MLLAVIQTCERLYVLFLNPSSWLLHLFEVAMFVSMIFFTFLASAILNNNYPDQPVMDRQKKQFNQQYILNFFALAFLIAFLITEIRQLIYILGLGLKFQSLSWVLFIPSFYFLVLVINQIIILVGMVKLRRELLRNFYEQASQITNGQ